MRRNRATEITIEVDQVLTISRRHRPRQAAGDWCSGCGAQVLMVTPDEATSLVRFSSRAIFRMIDAEQIHFAETGSGLIRLCVTSLLAAAAASGESKG